MEFGGEIVDTSGRYTRLDTELGRGAYKIVYKAIDRDDGIEVAWNQVRIDEEADMDKLMKEITILKQLKHPNVIVCHHAWVDEEKMIMGFITECMTSGTLRQFLKKVRSVKLKVLKNWCLQILEGLNYLHTRDPPIIHRDIKCDNIFINGNTGQVKIGDLGLATNAVNYTSAKLSIIGTPEFMAPEYYDEDYDEKVDIWAFGMCVLEIATLEYPYIECSNPAQVFKKVMDGKKPQSLSRIVDKDLSNFIQECLQPVETRKSASELLLHSFLENIDDLANNRNIQLLPKPQEEIPIVSQTKESKECSDMPVQPEDIPRSRLLQTCPENNRRDIMYSSPKHTAKPFDIPIDPIPRYNSKIKPILLCSGENTQGDMDLTVEVAPENSNNSSQTEMLTLKLTLDLGYEVTTIEFDYHVGKDTPLDVSLEMVRELELYESNVQAISQYIDAKVEEYLNHMNRLHDFPLKAPKRLPLQRSYSDYPLYVGRRNDILRPYFSYGVTSISDRSTLMLSDATVVLDDPEGNLLTRDDEMTELISTPQQRDKSFEELQSFKMIARSNNESCDAALKAFELKKPLGSRHHEKRAVALDLGTVL